MRAAGDMLSPCGYCFVSCDGGYLSVKVGEGWVSRVGLSSGVSGVDEGSDFAGKAGSEMFSETLGNGGLCGFCNNFVVNLCWLTYQNLNTKIFNNNALPQVPRYF